MASLASPQLGTVVTLESYALLEGGSGLSALLVPCEYVLSMISLSDFQKEAENSNFLMCNLVIFIYWQLINF